MNKGIPTEFALTIAKVSIKSLVILNTFHGEDSTCGTFHT